MISLQLSLLPSAGR